MASSWPTARAVGGALLGLIVVLTAWGCSLARRAPAAHAVVLAPVPAAEWPVLSDDLDTPGLVVACQQSLEYLERKVPADRSYRFGNESFTAAELATAVRAVVEVVTTEPDPVARTRQLQARLRLLRSVGRDRRGEVLFTGYYEPLIEARRRAAEPFVHPVYGVPDDLLTIDLTEFGLSVSDRPLVGRVDGRKVVPYPDRDAIDYTGAVQDKAQVLGYLADPVDLFFLHVQGSGTLLFPSGERIRVGYATSNGRPYRSIGKLLLDEQRMTVDEMSMQGIKAFLAANPDQVRRVLTHNPSYVFFRALPAQGGPLGCYGLPLTAGRSIATDRRLFPAPVVAWVRGSLPVPAGDVSADTSVPFSRFAVNQDTGGAIRGPGRVDLFFGAGDQAGEVAGRTKHLGELFLLLPR